MLDSAGRITATREPGATPGPLFALVRGATGCVWAARADVPHDIASELDDLAAREPPIVDLQSAPVYADRYVSLLEGQIWTGQTAEARLRQTGGPHSSAI